MKLRAILGLDKKGGAASDVEGADTETKTKSEPKVDDGFGAAGTDAKGGEFAQQREAEVHGIGRKTRVTKGDVSPASLTTDTIRAALQKDRLEALFKEPWVVVHQQSFAGPSRTDVTPGKEIPEGVMQRFARSHDTIEGRTFLWETKIADQPVYVMFAQSGLGGARLEVLSPDAQVLDFAFMPTRSKETFMETQWGVEDPRRARADRFAKSSTGDAQPSSPVEKPKTTLELLDTTPGAYLVQHRGGLAVRSANEPMEVTGGPGIPPHLLMTLASRDRPTVIAIQSSGNTLGGIVVPPGFNPTAGPFDLRVIVAPDGRTEEVLGALAKSRSKSFAKEGELLFVHDRVTGPQVRTPFDQFAHYSVASRLGGTRINPVLFRLELGDKPRGWVQTISAAVNAAVEKDAEAIASRWKAIADKRAAMLETVSSLDPQRFGSYLRAVTSLPTEPGATMHLVRYEQHVEQLQNQLDGMLKSSPENAIARAVDAVKYGDAIGAEDRENLEAVRAALPRLGAAIQKIVEARPEIFANVDPTTGRRFSETLRRFVDGGHATEQVFGTARFLTNIADKKFGGRLAGVDHVHGVARDIALEHPGLVLELVTAARERRPFPLHVAYDGDGRRELPVLGEMTRAFDVIGPNHLLGYEAALVNALGRYLPPTGRDVHPDLLRGVCPPVAIAAQKLTGQVMRYRHLPGLKTGEDLVAALRSQAPHGLAMANVSFRNGAGSFSKTFAHFFDFDPETKTVRVDAANGTSERVSVEGLEFTNTVAAYVRPHEVLDAFMKPELENRVGDGNPHLLDVHPSSLEASGAATRVPPDPAVVSARWKHVTDTRAELLESMSGLDERRFGSLLSRIRGIPTEARGDLGVLLQWERYMPQLKDEVDRAHELAKAVDVPRVERSYARPVEVAKAPELPPLKALTYPEAIGEADRAALDAVFAALPQIGRALQSVIDKRPDVFADVDSATGRRFAEVLKAFVDDGLGAKQPAGLARFLTNLADQHFGGHEPYFSHTHGLNKGIAMNHPGLILELIRAAQANKPYATHGVYDGDGARELPPLPEFQRGFEPVSSWGARGMLGYERGLLLATVKLLAPEEAQAHPDLLKGRSSLAAVAAQKLTNQRVRYRYADNIKTGEDLVAALETQGGYGLAMGDVAFTAGGQRYGTHFGHFNDYDPADGTVRVDDFMGRSYRVPVEGLRFVNTVAAYFRPHEGVDTFLTPKLETRRGDVHPSLEQRFKGRLDEDDASARS